MKRDMDFVRKLLIAVREADEYPNADALDLEGRDDENFDAKLAYHTKILAQAGYLEAIDMSSLAGSEWRIVNLTWKGQEFLESIENETVWNKTKEEVKKRGGGMTVEIIQGLALGLLKSHMGLLS